MNLQTWRMNRGRASAASVSGNAPIVRSPLENVDSDADRDIRAEGTDPAMTPLFQEIGIATPGRYRV